MRETAYAKINLALHVRKRRDDGYHVLETLFAFVDAGDTLSAELADRDSLRTVGPFAANIDNPFDNLVMRALSALPRPQGLSITLEKNLPVAAGLGGGSADAGAVFRMVEQLYGLPDNWEERAAKLGADVPSCVRSEMAVGLGTGTQLVSIENDMTGLPVLLVNPRVRIHTATVYAAWDQRDGGALEGDTARQITDYNRNDLESVVLKELAIPEVADALSTLNDTDPLIARMSGSGATCFALFDTLEQRDAAQAQIAAAHPEWWMLAGRLR
ncbi:MAG: 4-(cytidine 5'-diphospho)-2-C-methyl-D-erythritol kinase [Pseudomonadota bacterium]